MAPPHKISLHGKNAASSLKRGISSDLISLRPSRLGVVSSLRLPKQPVTRTPPLTLSDFAREPQVLLKALDHPDGPDALVREKDETGGVSRRALLVAAGTAGAALPALTLFSSDHNDRAIPSVSGQYDLKQAQLKALDIAGVCSTLYSQMASTARMESAGYMDAELFEQTCRRRLGSPYILESFREFEEVVPVLGAYGAYGASGKSGLAALFSAPRPARQQFETLTLEGLQRCRRVQRLVESMEGSSYTVAGVGLMLKDLKRLNVVLDQILSRLSLM